MDYIKATEVFPEDLLEEIQRYVQGELIYIPTRTARRKWGQNSGAAEYYRKRNHAIREAFRTGTGIERLSEQFGLSVDSIKKIVYSRS
ncbi:CD3324 family protein [Paenibacillus tengchongensis]|uniref:CD3324 family protein n=1 Tax=Paenibacillus tengchongensis TaxID=2608684 RepID=UPI00124E8427|nr:CD3324 family protein [Paenibacillus tengchongensis]